LRLIGRVLLGYAENVVDMDMAELIVAIGGELCRQENKGKLMPRYLADSKQ
jgi:hypothetical protein